MASFVAPVAPTLERADTNKTMHPPGAWTDDGSSDARDDAGESPMQAVGNTLSSAFTTAGSMAANYLPASVVGQLANYAPGIVPQSAKGLDEVKNSNPPAPDVNKPNDRSLNTFSDSKSVDNSPNAPFDAVLDKPINASLDKSLDNAINKPFDTSLDKPLDPSYKKSPNDIIPTPFASNVSGTTGAGYREQLSPDSITAATGHTPGISAPPSSAVTNSSGPSRDTSLPFGRSAGGSTDSETGYKSIGEKYPSFTTGEAGPGAVNAVLTASGTGTSGSMSSSDAGYKPPSDKEHNVPSSTISMKSGHIGSGPTHGALNTSVPPSRDTSLPADAGSKSGSMGNSITGNLPPIASPVDNGITPRASELEKDDLHYLAPAIASREKVVPTTAAASKPLVDTKFTEGSSAHPTPASPQSARSSDASGHSRNASGASSVSVGGTPKHKVTLAKRIKGEAKILSGKLTKNTDKVQQGRDILSGEL